MTISKKNSGGLFDDAPHTKIFDVGACQELFENANDLIQSVDENGRVIDVSRLELGVFSVKK